VLDEHLWITSQCGNIEGTELQRKLCEGMAIRSGRSSVCIDEATVTRRSRCVACTLLPFTGQRSSSFGRFRSEKPLRTDVSSAVLQHSVWPLLLTTTFRSARGFGTFTPGAIVWSIGISAAVTPPILNNARAGHPAVRWVSIRRAIVDNLRVATLVD